MIVLINILFAAVPIGALIWGFRLAGRWVENVALQLLLGGLIGVGIIITILSILLTGCILVIETAK